MASLGDGAEDTKPDVESPVPVPARNVFSLSATQLPRQLCTSGSPRTAVARCFPFFSLSAVILLSETVALAR